MGLSDDRNYARYHQVLNRAVWSPRQAARILLGLLILHLDQGDGPLIFGIDETLERRRGPKIKSLCPASTIFAGWRQSVLPVHLLGLAPLLGSVGTVSGDVKLQDACCAPF